MLSDIFLRESARFTCHTKSPTELLAAYGHLLLLLWFTATLFGDRRMMLGILTSSVKLWYSASVAHLHFWTHAPTGCGWSSEGDEIAHRGECKRRAD